MNGTPAPDNEQPQSVQISCHTCMWLSQIRPSTGEGECWFSPPQVVVLFGQRANIANAQQQTVQQPTKIRPTMRPGEYCAHWSPCQPGWKRATVQEPH